MIKRIITIFIILTFWCGFYSLQACYSNLKLHDVDNFIITFSIAQFLTVFSLNIVTYNEKKIYCIKFWWNRTLQPGKSSSIKLLSYKVCCSNHWAISVLESSSFKSLATNLRTCIIYMTLNCWGTKIFFKM